MCVCVCVCLCVCVCVNTRPGWCVVFSACVGDTYDDWQVGAEVISCSFAGCQTIKHTFTGSQRTQGILGSRSRPYKLLFLL